MAELPTDPQHFTRAVTELGELRPVVTTRAIFNTNGIKIVETGVSVNAGLYERLMQHQLSSPLEDSVASTPTVTGRMLRDGAEESIRTVPFFARLALDAETRDILLNTMERLPLPAPIAFQLTLAFEVRPALYRRSLGTALVAAWLAMEPRVSRFNISIAAAAGLLHDIGMLHLDPLLLEYKNDLNRLQRRQLYSHPLISTVLIERHSEYPKEVVRAVREHHEFLDGSGYPRNLVGDDISHMGRILALAELIVGVFGPGREAPELRLFMLLRMNTHRYDEALVEKVIRILQPPHDSTSASVSLLDDPAKCLLGIHGVLSGWPAGLADRLDVSEQRRENLKVLTSQVSQLHRTLASVGAAPEQLAQIGSEPLGNQLHTELTLLASEAAWQLRTLARQARRRWRVEPDGSFPAELQEWLDRVDEVISHISGAPLTDGHSQE